MPSTHKKRGQANCPKYSESYYNWYKRKDCSNCGEYIGCSCISNKKDKKIKPPVRLTPSIASVMTSICGNRYCVARNETGSWICLYKGCKGKCAMHVNAVCKSSLHTSMVIWHWITQTQQFNNSIAAEEMSKYPCSSAVQEKLASSIQYATLDGFAQVVQIA